MELSKFEIPAAGRAGQWFEIVRLNGRFYAVSERELRGPEWKGAVPDGARLKLGSTHGEEYRLALQNEMVEAASDGMNRAGRRSARRGQAVALPSAERQTEAQIGALAVHVLLDWEGITEGGAALPCTLENRIKALGQIDFRDMVIEAADDLAAFAEAELGNSAGLPVSSSG